MPLAVIRRLLAGRPAAPSGTRTMSDPAAAHPTCTPSVSLSVDPYPEGDGVRVGLVVALKPPADVAARADAIGPRRDVGGAFVAKCRAAPEVARWQVLRERIRDAEAASAKAAEAVRAADAGRVLLERELSENLVEELRRVRAEADAAVAARDAALQDLAEVRYLVPKHFVAAANALNSITLTTFTPHARAVSDLRAAAEAKLRDAIAAATKAVEQVLAEHLAGPVAELLVARRADRLAWGAQPDEIRDAVRAELLGAVPAGVRQVGGHRFEVVPPPAPPAGPPPPVEPPPMNSYGVRVVPPGPAARVG
jgi:hypothetical protein